MKKVTHILLLWIVLFSPLFAFPQNAENKKAVSTQEKNYFTKYIYPLSSCNPDIDFSKDSIVFGKFFADAKLIGLGEASHGSSEIFQIKDKIARYILKKNKGGVLAMEASMPNSFLVNEYIIENKRNAKDYLMNIKSWIYQTHEIMNMIEWMKKFNDNHTEKINFAGFDMTTSIGPAVQIKMFLTKYKIPEDDWEQLMKRLYEYDKLKKNQLAEKKKLRSECSVLINNLKKNTDAVPDQKEKSWILQNLRLLEQYLDLTYEKRNEYMAENINWLQQNYPGSALILWAHNEHIKKSGDETGRFLSEKFKNKYLNCGTFFYDGYHSVIDENSKITSAYIDKPESGSFEDFLNSFNIPLFILDVKSIREDKNEKTKMLLKKINYRTIGAALSNNDNHSGVITDDFDYIIFIKNTTQSKILEK